jgi:hypothetical protein
MTVDLPLEDWQKVLAILSQGQWGQVNHLMMAIGEQLKVQAQPPEARPKGNGVDAEAAPHDRR